MSKMSNMMIRIEELINEGHDFEWIAIVTGTSIEFVNEVACTIQNEVAYVIDNDYED